LELIGSDDENLKALYMDLPAALQELAALRRLYLQECSSLKYERQTSAPDEDGGLKSKAPGQRLGNVAAVPEKKGGTDTDEWFVCLFLRPIEFCTFRQQPGELVFVPSGWCHGVWNSTDCLSINHNWINPWNLGRMAVLCLYTLLASHNISNPYAPHHAVF